MKRQQSIAKLAAMTASTKAVTHAPETASAEPEPVPSTSTAIAEVTADLTATQPPEPTFVPEEEEDEDFEEIISSGPSKSRSGPPPEIPSPTTTPRRKRKTPVFSEAGTMERIGVIVSSLKSLHKKHDALDDWLSKRDEVRTLIITVIFGVTNGLIHNLMAGIHASKASRPSIAGGH